MAYPAMSPRRLFWTIMAVSALWCVAGWRWDADVNKPRWMKKTQWAAAAPVNLILVPANFIFTGMQNMARATIERVTLPPGNESKEMLSARVHALESQNAQLSLLLNDAYSKLQAFQHLPNGLTERDVLPAKVLGFEAGPGASLMHIDKGSMDGIKEWMPVMAMNETAILGRVERVGTKESVVRLLTDPSKTVQAEIVRGIQKVTTAASPCVVEGVGGAQMRIMNVDVQSCVPDPGDLVVLSDPAWPASTQFMVIGQIDRVARRTEQQARYLLTVSPRVRATSQGTVMVVLKQ